MHQMKFWMLLHQCQYTCLNASALTVLRTLKMFPRKKLNSAIQKYDYPVNQSTMKLKYKYMIIVQQCIIHTYIYVSIYMYVFVHVDVLPYLQRFTTEDLWTGSTVVIALPSTLQQRSMINFHKGAIKNMNKWLRIIEKRDKNRH